MGHGPRHDERTHGEVVTQHEHSCMGQSGGHSAGGGVTEGINGAPCTTPNFDVRIGQGELLRPSQLVDVGEHLDCMVAAAPRATAGKLAGSAA